MSTAWARWRQFAHRVAAAQSNALLFLLYYLVLLPIALLRRPFGDPLDLRGDVRASWRMRPPPPSDLESARRQF